jgi:hypothetical protein
VAQSGEDGWVNVWNRRMDHGVVRFVRSEDKIGLLCRHGKDIFSYPYFVLEPMKKKNASLAEYFEKYKAHGIAESVKRNSHMNNIQGEIDEDAAILVLDGYLSLIPWNPLGMTIRKILENMTDIAKEAKYGEEEDRAVIADFINFVGSIYYVNYGLYAKDLI